MDLSSLSDDLPRQASARQQLASLDNDLISEFKAAACAVTKLYKLSGAKTTLLKKQGYLDALDDIVKVMQNGEDAVQWILLKRAEMTKGDDAGQTTVAASEELERDRERKREQDVTEYPVYESTANDEKVLEGHTAGKNSSSSHSPSIPTTENRLEPPHDTPSYPAAALQSFILNQQNQLESIKSSSPISSPLTRPADPVRLPDRSTDSLTGSQFLFSYPPVQSVRSSTTPGKLFSLDSFQNENDIEFVDMDGLKRRASFKEFDIKKRRI